MTRPATVARAGGPAARLNASAERTPARSRAWRFKASGWRPGDAWLGWGTGLFGQPQPPPVSIERIRRELRQAPPAITQADLKYFVQVYGQAPKIELFIRKEESVGAVPWGAPTHQDFLNLWTPEAFRAPAVDFNALLRWLAQQASKKKDGGG